MRFFFIALSLLVSLMQDLYAHDLGYRHYLQKTALPHKPPLLLVHGLVSSKETWEPVIKGLQSEFGEIWSLDLPGYGDSYKARYKTLKDVREALNRFVQEHKIVTPVVIAHSMGAQLSVLCHDILKPSVFIIEDMDMQQRKRPAKNNFQIFESGFKTRAELLNALESGAYYKATRDMIDRDFVVKENDRWFSKINPHTDFYYRENVSSNAEVRNAWKSLPVTLPILVLQASKGSALSEHGLRFMKESHPKIEFKKIPASDHSIHRSRPQEFLTAVQSFLLSLRP